MTALRRSWTIAFVAHVFALTFNMWARFYLIDGWERAAKAGIVDPIPRGAIDRGTPWIEYYVVAASLVIGTALSWATTHRASKRLRNRAMYVVLASDASDANGYRAVAAWRYSFINPEAARCRAIAIYTQRLAVTNAAILSATIWVFARMQVTISCMTGRHVDHPHMTIPIVAALTLFSLFHYPSDKRVYRRILDFLPRSTA